MAFTNGSLYGLFDGQATGDVTNTAFNQSNTTNPNLSPKNDLFQILAPGGACLLQVNSAGTVSTNVAAVSPLAGPQSYTETCIVAQVQMTVPQYLGLASPTGSTAAQICQAAFPLNYNGAQLDIFQIGSFSPTVNVAGGGGVIYRLSFNGTAATS